MQFRFDATAILWLIILIVLVGAGLTFALPYINQIQSNQALAAATQTGIAINADRQAAVAASTRAAAEAEAAQAQAQQTQVSAQARAEQTRSAASAALAPTVAYANWQATVTAVAVNVEATRVWNSAQAAAMVTATAQAGQYQIARLQAEQQASVSQTAAAQQAAIKSADNAQQLSLTDLQIRAARERREQDNLVYGFGALATIGVLAGGAVVGYRAWRESRRTPNTAHMFERALEAGQPVVVQDGSRLIGFNVVEKAPANAQGQRPTVVVMNVPALQGPPIQVAREIPERTPVERAD